MTAVRSLLWKDARLARAYLLCGAAVVLAPHAFLGYARLRWGVAISEDFDWNETLYFTGLLEGLAGLMVMALLAAASFATERADRSAEFLAYLPVSRAKRLLSKLAIAACPVALLAIGNPVLLYDMAPGWEDAELRTQELLSILACSGVMIFGTAWLSSVRVSSAAALLMGLLSPFFVTALFFLCVEGANSLFGLEISRDRWFPIVYRRAGVVLGLVTWSLGSWLFITRDEA